MVERRPFSTLGGANHGWLDTKHHFSFADYHDPARMGLGNLRVWNDDTIAAKAGFPPHAHRDMEIVTYVREGAISHRDGLGNAGKTSAGDVQVMSAGDGIVHAEVNEQDVTSKIFQIWLQPRHRGGAPRWATRPFPHHGRDGRLVVLASGLPEDFYADGDALRIGSDARVLAANLRAGTDVVHALAPARKLYAVASVGAFCANGVTLQAGDGLAVADEGQLALRAIDDVQLVLVETA